MTIQPASFLRVNIHNSYYKNEQIESPTKPRQRKQLISILCLGHVYQFKRLKFGLIFAEGGGYS